MKRLYFLLLLVFSPAWADVTVDLCHGYGCIAQATIRYPERLLLTVGRRLAVVQSAAEERHLLSLLIGEMYAFAGASSVLRNDRGGNFADDGVEGRMDCIDHSTSTTRLLRLFEARGYLHWHRVLEPEVRGFFGVHYSAAIEELAGDNNIYVVDSWFVDNGKPAVILPLEDWKKGAGPDV